MDHLRAGPAFPGIGESDDLNFQDDQIFEPFHPALGNTPGKSNNFNFFGGENSNRGGGLTSGGIFDDLEDPNVFENCDNNFMHEEDDIGVADHDNFLLSPANGAIQEVDVVDLDAGFDNL